jgi:hypothetical protein
MSSLSDIRAMGSILQRKSRGRIWNNDIPKSVPEKNKSTKRKDHIHWNWDKDLWD